MKRTLTVGLLSIIMLSMLSTVRALELERPNDHITINERVDTSRTDGKASVGLGVHIGEYIENKVNWPSNGDDDVVDFAVIATANTRVDITYDIGDIYSFFWYDVNARNYYLEDGQYVPTTKFRLRPIPLRLIQTTKIRVRN